MCCRCAAHAVCGGSRADGNQQAPGFSPWICLIKNQRFLGLGLQARSVLWTCSA